MIDNFIKTVKNQIAYFDHVLEKNPKHTATQAKFWPLKYEFEQLLAYLEKQKDSYFKKEPQLLSSLENIDPIIDAKKLFAKNFKETNELTTTFQEDILPIKKEYLSREQASKIDSAIVEIVKNNPPEIDKNRLTALLKNNYHIEINDHQLSSRLWNMCNKKNVLINLRRGFYKIIDN